MTHRSRLPAFSCGVWNWFWVNRSSWNSFSICSPFTVCPPYTHTQRRSSSTMSTPLDFPRINLEFAFEQPLFRVPLIAGRLDKLSVLYDFLGSHLGLPLIGHQSRLQFQHIFGPTTQSCRDSMQLTAFTIPENATVPAANCRRKKTRGEKSNSLHGSYVLGIREQGLFCG